MKDNEKSLVIHPVNENGQLDAENVILPITRKECVLENDTDAPIVFQRPITSMNAALILTSVPSTNPEEEPKAAKLNLDVSSLYNQLKETIFNNIYPVGSLYMSTDASLEDPANILGFGTWERIKDTFLYAADDDIEDYNVNKTGGNNKAQLLWHTHTSNFANAQSITTSKAYPTKSGVSELEGTFNMLERELNGGHEVTWDYKNIISDEGGGDPNTGVDIIGNHHQNARKIKVDAKHTHNISIPALTITGTGDTDTNSKLNMPKFLCVKIWKRVADN